MQIGTIILPLLPIANITTVYYSITNKCFKYKIYTYIFLIINTYDYYRKNRYLNNYL